MCFGGGGGRVVVLVVVVLSINFWNFIFLFSIPIAKD